MPDGAREPFDGVIGLLCLKRQQPHQVHGIGTSDVRRQRLLAAHLRIEDAAGLEMLMTQVAKRSGSLDVGSFGVSARIRPVVLAGGLAFATVHGHFSMMESARRIK